MPKNEYHPIDCNYYDELVLLVMQKKPCEIVYRNKDGEHVRKMATIADVFTKEKAEYLKLSNDQLIRLDYLISADGKENKLSCS